MGYGDMKKMDSIMWETGVFPDNINGVPFDILWVEAKVMQAKLSDDDSEPYKPSEKELERAGEFQKELEKGAEQQFGKTVGRKAHKYLVERGVEHAMSYAIEDGELPARPPARSYSALLTFPPSLSLRQVKTFPFSARSLK